MKGPVLWRRMPSASVVKLGGVPMAVAPWIVSDELWELIAATHAEIRLREFPVEAWRLNLELLTKRSEN